MMFEIGDWVKIPGSQPCMIVQIAKNNVRVENPLLIYWTAWWDKGSLIRCEV